MAPRFPSGLSPSCIDLWWDNNGLIQPNVMYAPDVFKLGPGKHLWADRNSTQGLTHKTKPWEGAVTRPLPTRHLYIEIFQVKNPCWTSWVSRPRNCWVENKKYASGYPPAKVYATIYQLLNVPFQVCASAQLLAQGHSTSNMPSSYEASSFNP